MGSPNSPILGSYLASLLSFLYRGRKSPCQCPWTQLTTQTHLLPFFSIYSQREFPGNQPQPEPHVIPIPQLLPASSPTPNSCLFACTETLEPLSHKVPFHCCSYPHLQRGCRCPLSKGDTVCEMPVSTISCWSICDTYFFQRTWVPVSVP